MLWSGEFGETLPNWQVGALSSVLIKLGLFLRKRLILRQAGEHAAAGCGQGCTAEKKTVSVPTSHASIPLRLESAGLANTRVLNTREGSGLPTTSIVCMSARELKSHRAAMCVNDRCIKTCVCMCKHVCMTSLWPPNLPASLWGPGAGRERVEDRGSFVCVWPKY